MNPHERWDIVFLKIDDKDAAGRPAVILSNPDILNDPRHLRINVVTGTKKPPSAQARPHQVILDGADGLELATLFDCGFVSVARKTSIQRTAGRVSYARRGQIAARIRASLGLG
jgi:mRNA-degrading endonuclease toxin of MazEF toxin-antitoxin module